MTTNSLLTKAASTLAAICITTTSFAEITRAETIEFAYSPIELANSEGVTQLEERISDAARRACEANSPLYSPKMRRECREDITAQLRDQIWSEQG